MSQKQIVIIFPDYRGNPERWARDLVLVLSQEMQKILGRLNDDETKILDHETRLTNHGI